MGQLWSQLHYAQSAAPMLRKPLNQPTLTSQKKFVLDLNSSTNVQKGIEGITPIIIDRDVVWSSVMVGPKLCIKWRTCSFNGEERMLGKWCRTM